MVSVGDSQIRPTRFHTTRPYYYTPPQSSSKTQRPLGRSMRTIRSTLYQSENLTDSVLDLRLGELATQQSKTLSFSEQDFLEFSKAFSDYSACSSDISGELQRLATLPAPKSPALTDPTREPEPEPCQGFLQRESFSTEIIECISPEDLLPTVNLCIEGLNSCSIAVKRSAAAKLRLLAKNRADNRALIAESGAVPFLIHLLRSTDPRTQEHAVTALLNLLLLEENRKLVTDHGAIKPLIYVLKTGTDTSKQNAACALLNLSYLDENKVSVGGSGAIPPLVALLRNGTSRGKKDAITVLYKICAVKVNKERAVNAGVVKLLVEMVGEQGSGMAEKAMVVLSSLAGTEGGRSEIVEIGGIPALVEAIEDGSMKGKEFALLTLLQLCSDNVRNRGLLVREGVIPPLVAFSQSGTAKAKHKAETLLGYLREPRNEASSSSP
ncbi:uncharacterized protein LOC141677827 [Apium graveolens]|uniref:uncharacterized protein LOC141677827 n=1 Tax=Apium graveolens TaxID=4045 RepID=UPI003D78B805